MTEDFKNPVASPDADDVVRDERATPDAFMATTFDVEDAKSTSPKRSFGAGLSSIRGKATSMVKQAADSATSAVNTAVNTAVHTAAHGLEHGLEQASKVKELKKFVDLDLEVFSSTEEADRKEQEEDLRNRRKWCGVLHPETTNSMLYNQLHVWCLIYMAYILPVRTAFMIDPSPGTTAFLVDVAIDLLIVVDIFLNFHKFTKKGAELITDKKQIKAEYLSGWFIIDFLSVLPVNYLILLLNHNTDASNTTHSIRFMRFTRIARFVRLIKLAKIAQLRVMMRVFKDFLHRLGVSGQEVEFFVRMVLLVAVMLGIGHFIACLWLHVGRTNLEEDKGWMAGNHELVRLEGPNGTLGLVKHEYVREQYIDSFYWAIVTMSSVGYGDILPMETDERQVAVFVITVGAFLYAYIIGAFSSIMAALDYDTTRYDTKMRTVASHLKHFGVDKTVARRVNQFYEFRFQNKLMFEDDDILGELPVKLKSTIVLQRFQKTVERVPFFRGLNEDIVILICVQFREFSVLPGDDIVHRGDPYRELLVLSRGAARSVPAAEEEAEKPNSLSPRSKRQEVEDPSQDQEGSNGSVDPYGLLGVDESMDKESSDSFRQRFHLDAIDAVIEYPTGSIFGELEFLGLVEMRPSTIRAKVYTELSSIHPHDIEPIIDKSPALRERLGRYSALKETISGSQMNEVSIEKAKEAAEDEFASESDGMIEVDTASAAELLGGSGHGTGSDREIKHMCAAQSLYPSGQERLEARMDKLEASKETV